MPRKSRRRERPEALVGRRVRAIGGPIRRLGMVALVEGLHHLGPHEDPYFLVSFADGGQGFYAPGDLGPERPARAPAREGVRRG